MLISEFLSRLPAFACALGLASQIVLMSTQSTEAQKMKPTILLVHGAWADSSSWNGVVDLLLKDGYDVRALPNTLRGLEADAAVVSTYPKPVSGPVVLVGHSYGGSVISVASANAPNVKALVYVDAFVPEAGESVQEELASAPPPPADFAIAVPFTTPTGGDADLYVNAKYFGAIFASAESPEVAARLAATQRPFAARCLTDKAPAAIGWKMIPSWRRHMLTKQEGRWMMMTEILRWVRTYHLWQSSPDSPTTGGQDYVSTKNTSMTVQSRDRLSPLHTAGH